MGQMIMGERGHALVNQRVNQVIDDVVYLASCAVRTIPPDKERIGRMNLNLVFREANRHHLAGCCAFALESVDMCDDEFTQAKADTIRRIILMDVQRKEVLGRLEEAGIWYMPLKGIVLKDYYPSTGMRDMSDNDILFDASRTEDMRTIMTELGFTGAELGKGAHDTFYKEPIYNFEMHRTLFEGYIKKRTKLYYANIMERLLHQEGTEHGYMFSPEDFYLHLIIHEYKHYRGGGTGLRTCFDNYVYLSKMALDFDYIRQVAEKLHIADFELTIRALSQHLIEGDGLPTDEARIFDYLCKSGVYGNLESKVEHLVEEGGGGLRGKLSYMRKRAFPSMAFVESQYPFFYRHKLLLPLVPIVRFAKAITTSRAKVLSEIKALRKQ